MLLRSTRSARPHQNSISWADQQNAAEALNYGVHALRDADDVFAQHSASRIVLRQSSLHANKCNTSAQPRSTRVKSYGLAVVKCISSCIEHSCGRCVASLQQRLQTADNKASGRCGREQHAVHLSLTDTAHQLERRSAASTMLSLLQQAQADPCVLPRQRASATRHSQNDHDDAMQQQAECRAAAVQAQDVSNNSFLQGQRLSRPG